LVADKLERRKLYPVAEAPEISLKAYAVFPVHGEHRALIEKLLEKLSEEDL
jgi:hypothetical protein